VNDRDASGCATVRPWVLVPCSAPKLDRAAPAGQIYTGAFHRACRAAAAELADPDRQLIVSGLHGLLTLTDEVGPYDQRIDGPGAVTLEQLTGQVAALGPGPLWLLLPRAYRSRIEQAAAPSDRPTLNLMEGCRGIFEMRGRLRQLREGELSACDLQPV
jgi:hypothetical protein